MRVSSGMSTGQPSRPNCVFLLSWRSAQARSEPDVGDCVGLGRFGRRTRGSGERVPRSGSIVHNGRLLRTPASTLRYVHQEVVENQKRRPRISTCRSSDSATYESNVKIAFVNQPIDTILPPYQSSVGACTYGAACSLSKSCEIIVYGTMNQHKDFPADFREQNVYFRFFRCRYPTGSRLKPRKFVADFSR